MIERVDQLATRALGDVFEQLERVGAAGRGRCRPPAYVGEVVPIGRYEAVELVQLAQDALNYARVHVDYLKSEPRQARRVSIGDRVVVLEDEGPWRGTIVEVLGDGRLRVRADNGETTEIREAHELEAAE